MPQPQQWYIRSPQGVEGPFSPKQIRTLARDGGLKREQFVSQDREHWILAAQLAVPFAGFTPPAAAQPTSTSPAPPASTSLGEGSRPAPPRPAKKEEPLPDDSPFAPTAEFPSVRWEELLESEMDAQAAAPSSVDAAATLWKETAPSPRMAPPAADSAPAAAHPAAAHPAAAGGPAASAHGTGGANLYATAASPAAATASFSHQETPPHRPPQMALDAVSADIDWMLAHREEAIPGYELETVLGRGGMGVVFRARQTKLDRQVAIKCMLVSQVQNHTALARFEKEARTIAKLRHLNVVQAYDFGQHDGRLFLVMELLQGEDLETVLEREKRLPEAFVWGVVRQAASGLAHATELGIVHRDVKPANLFLVQPPAGLTLPQGMRMVKVTDFGIAMLSLDSEESKRLTAENTSMGTPLYMAPEQGFGADVDCRADIYALGASTFHLLAGFPPYDGSNPLHIMMQKMKQPLPRLSERFGDVSPESDALLADMQAGDVKKRIPDYATLLARIDALPCLQGNAPLPSAIRSTVSGSVVRSSAGPSGDLASFFDDEEKEAATGKKGAGGGRRFPILLAAVVALVAVAAGVVRYVRNGGLLRPTAAKTLVAPKTPLTLQSDYVLPLFNGESINDWLLDRGQWKAAVDEEQGKVLRGSGVVRRQLPPLGMYRVSCGADLRKTKKLELRFAVTKKGKYYALRLEGGKAQFVAGDGEGEEVPKGSAVPANVDPDELKYVELRIERQGDFWWAFYDGKPIGVAPRQPEPELDEVQFHVDGEIALEEIAQSRLVEPEAK